ncbi:MAG: phosphate ABC transporter substrate-binding protein [Puniceicoccales bacterium]|jgi:phosphate transport system substrate-binding protein|nr:phosphate ABC transporter substrate-binding protein [Puniceicoccales bacterium]
MKNSLKKLVSLAAVAALGTAVLSAGPIQLDEKIPPYQSTSGVSGNLNSIGSDTLNNLMTFWAEAFKVRYPNVNIQIEGKGSATAPPALANGTAQIAPMSRPMKKEEIAVFEKKYGYKPTEIKVSIDALGVFVNKDNPIKGLSLKQIDSAFSSTLKRGGQPVANWGALQLSGEWGSKPISLYGRNSASGTYGFFKEHALKKGDFKNSVKEQPGSSSVVQGVASDLGGIGYSGIGYLTAGVRALPLSEKDGEQFIEPSYENCLNGTYPLGRFLYVYVNRAPGKPADKLTEEFLKFVLSKEGQEIVVKDGYYPLNADLSKEGLDLLK